MCLILFALNSHPRLPLVLAANRDEFFARPTRAAHFWTMPTTEQLLAGQDLEAGGTWLGINRNGRFAAVTNIRDPSISRQARLSRGKLVVDFLLGNQEPEEYLSMLQTQTKAYAGFNLLAGDTNSFCYLNSDRAEVRTLSPGVYGLSNGRLDEPWPKVRKGKQSLKTLLEQVDVPAADALLPLLQDRTLAPDSELPHTGMPLELERQLSAAFINNARRQYGTRCSTTVTRDSSGLLHFCEQNYDTAGATTTRQYFEFTLC